MRVLRRSLAGDPVPAHPLMLQLFLFVMGLVIGLAVGLPIRGLWEKYLK